MTLLPASRKENTTLLGMIQEKLMVKPSFGLSQYTRGGGEPSLSRSCVRCACTVFLSLPAIGCKQKHVICVWTGLYPDHVELPDSSILSPSDVVLSNA